MIYDTIFYADRYGGLYPGIDRVLKEVIAYTPENYPGGRVDLEGDDIYLNLAEYDTHGIEAGLAEAHREYIDVMYMVEGTEVIYVKPVDRLRHVTKEYDPAIEALLADIDEDGCEIRLEKGDFVILFPEDAHAPACHADGQVHVKKIIGKVKINS